MTARIALRRTMVVATAVTVTASGCAFQGLNSLPLPGAVGRGSDANTFIVEVPNVATLESNSPVQINDVTVGSVGEMRVKDWHAEVVVSVKPDVVVPANAVATVGQTSLLGSLHLALDPPVGQAPAGRLQPGATIPLDRSSTYPTTEETLSSLSVVVNGGGLGQIGDVIRDFNLALTGRQADFRDLLTHFDNLIGTLDAQRDNLVETVKALNRLAGTFAGKSDVIDRALRDIPSGLAVLAKERPRLTTALRKLGTFSDTATQLVNDTQADLVRNLQNLDPTVRALADVGKNLDGVLSYATVFPYGQDLIDRGLRGDYFNLFVDIDLSLPRLRRETALGTRFANPDRPLVPLPGEPYYQRYTYDPLNLPFAGPPASRPDGRVPGDLTNPPTPALDAPTPGSLSPANQLPLRPRGPVLPVAPPEDSTLAPADAPPAPGGSIFAGPYPAQNPPPAPSPQGGG